MTKNVLVAGAAAALYGALILTYHRYGQLLIMRHFYGQSIRRNDFHVTYHESTRLIAVIVGVVIFIAAFLWEWHRTRAA